MRVSVIETDEGYENWLNRGDKLFDVFLNGEKLSECRTADEEKGLVECVALDRNGHYIVWNDEVLTVVLFGKVEIEAIEW